MIEYAVSEALGPEGMSRMAHNMPDLICYDRWEFGIWNLEIR